MGLGRARTLRDRSTDAERAMWRALRNRRLSGHKFRRQHPIEPYVVDFFCISARLIVEIDGGQHADRENDDAKRTAHLESRGFKVIRCWNNEIFENMDGVQQAILEHLKAQASSPQPSPPKGGEGESNDP